MLLRNSIRSHFGSSWSNTLIHRRARASHRASRATQVAQVAQQARIAHHGSTIPQRQRRHPHEEIPPSCRGGDTELYRGCTAKSKPQEKMMPMRGFDDVRAQLMREDLEQREQNVVERRKRKQEDADDEDYHAADDAARPTHPVYAQRCADLSRRSTICITCITYMFHLSYVSYLSYVSHTS